MAGRRFSRLRLGAGSLSGSILLCSIFMTLLAVTATATEQQRPLDDHLSGAKDDHESEFVAEGSSTWKFNFSSSAPHYFASVYGLLQQWPNTFFPNGHSIAPCEIAPFTKLYHGRLDAEEPPSPEWVAFDVEMAYGIMGSFRNSHMLTYQTTRPMKCIYFDGESATLMGSGQMDTQMLHLYGNVSGPSNGERFRGLFDEYARATGLCDWIHEKKLGGSGWGFEGVVRMNAGFEMIVCDFSSPTLRLISHLNVTAPLLPAEEDEESTRDMGIGEAAMPLAKRDEGSSYYPLPPSQTRSDRVTNPTNPPMPPNWRRDREREPFLRSQGWGWFTSATEHYGSSGLGPHVGETRVKVLSCGILSYYSPAFHSAESAHAKIEQKSLNLTSDGFWKGPGANGSKKEGLTHLTRRRRAHTLGDVSVNDAITMKEASEAAFHELLSSSPNCSGMDWSGMTNEIVQRNSGYLDGLAQMLQKYEELPVTIIKNQTAIQAWMKNFRDQTHSFLLPYLEYPSASKQSEEKWSRSSELFKATYARCRFHHTRLLDPDQGIFLGAQEKTVKWAVEETYGGICDVMVDIGLSVESVWESKFNSPLNDTREVDNVGLSAEITRWREGVLELMAWLGWAGEWVSCDKKCAWDEKCFIPMWPLMARREGWGGGPGHGPPSGGDGPPGKGREDPQYPSPYRGPYPGFGRPYGPPGGGPGRGRGRPPGFGSGEDEKELWAPVCVKIEYIMG
ncbi:hypothetical protein BP6252_01736 [Coleophoma cylindrospora]|uniref:Uncharacterized protein n=1 Tax=Coleophoma cylindrospora TaxID=1849047 RepID=A0A3D8STX0_9HELO|nr:hypothetical protein BP6252_01736 [Coleophoma cylindrospora]